MNNKTITNGEKIRLLTDLELAKIIAADYGGCHSKNKQKPCCRAINTNGSNRR